MRKGGTLRLARSAARWAVWCGVGIIAMAVMAPLVANNGPYVMWGEGVDGLQLPMARAMTTAEWFGICGALFAVIAMVWRKRFATRRGALILGGTGLFVAIAVTAFVSNGRLRLDAVDYRATAEAGNVSMVLPPIAHGWAEVHLDERYQPPGRSDLNGRLHLLGTDKAGADAAARLVYGARIAVVVGLLSAGLAMAIGVVCGLCLGYFGGWVDLIGMRVIELFMAVPRLFLVLTAVVFLPVRESGMSLAALILVIGFTGWMRPARLMRAEALRVRSEDYVAAARAMGLSRSSILFRHMLPNAIAPALVDGGFMVASAILMETNLSFLGLGVKAPQPSWGLMLSEAIDRSTGEIYWWLVLGPGVMILLTVLVSHSLSDSLRVRLSGRRIAGGVRR